MWHASGAPVALVGAWPCPRVLSPASHETRVAGLDELARAREAVTLITARGQRRGCDLVSALDRMLSGAPEAIEAVRDNALSVSDRPAPRRRQPATSGHNQISNVATPRQEDRFRIDQPR